MNDSVNDEALTEAKRVTIDALDRARRRRILEATAMTVYAAMKGQHPAKFGFNEEGLVDHAWKSAELFVSRMPPEQP